MVRALVRPVAAGPGVVWLGLWLGFVLFGAGAYPQDATEEQAAPAAEAAGAPAQEEPAPEDLAMFDEVVVTANVNQGTKLESSIAVSTVTPEAVESAAPRSTAEIFRNVPGVRSESTGGEGNANIAVRGLPVAAGGAKFLQLHEDGLPVLEFGDIAFGNADIFVRYDATVDQVEAVRGGSASTYASNSPGGVINLITKTGVSAGGSLGVTSGIGYDSTRLEGAFGTMLGEGWSLNLGGFYRNGEGVRRAGYTAEDGGQLRASLTRYLENGFLRVSAKHLDDRAIGYLPMPVRVTGSNSSPRFGGFASFDPGEDSPHSVYFLRDTGLDGQNNRRTTDIADGMHPVSTSIGAEISFELEGGWSISDKFRVSRNSGRFVSPFPAEVASAAAIAPTIGGDGARLIYANGPNAGQAYGGLVIRTHLFNTEINDFGNTINDLQLAKSFELPSANLDLRFGYYKSRQSIDMDWTWNSYLQELSGDDAALLDVVDRNGRLRSDGGLYAYGVPFWGNCCQRNYDTDYDIDAPYVALSYANEKLTVDASVRHDSGQGQGTYAGTLQASNFDVDGDGVISAPERSVSLIDRGNPSSVNYDWSYTSFSVGANYLFTRDLAGFARVSQGGRANADRLLFGLVRPDGSVREEDAVDEVEQVELGVKWRRERVSLFATAFFATTDEQNFEATSQRFLDRTYDARGLELEVFSRFGDLTVNGGLTWTDAEISDDQITPSNVGNTPRRQADFVYQATAIYRQPRWQASLNLIGTTDAYAQDNNELVMPGFNQVNLSGQLEITRRLSLLAGINNLFDEFGLTESEEGSIVAGRENIIRARSIPGRSATLSLRLDF